MTESSLTYIQKTALWMDKLKYTGGFDDVQLWDTKGRCTFGTNIAEFELDELSRFVGEQGAAAATLNQMRLSLGWNLPALLATTRSWAELAVT